MKYILVAFLVVNNLWASHSLENVFHCELMMAELGNVVSANKVGHFYYRGEGVGQSYAQALKWLLKAADGGSFEAQFTLGNMFKRGLGVHKDMKEAVRFYRSAADLGYTKAQFNLGLLYYKGDEVDKNLKTALRWFETSAQKGDARSLCFLAEMHEKGKGGLSRDYVRAISYYEMSQRQGYQRAETRLSALLLKISDVKMSTKAAPTARAEPECSICLDKKLTRAFIPCGHTTCETCAGQLQPTCPICKRQIDRLLTIYISG